MQGSDNILGKYIGVTATVLDENTGAGCIGVACPAVACAVIKRVLRGE